MLKDKKFTFSLHALIITITLLCLAIGSLFTLLLKREQWLAEEASIATNAAWSRTITEIQDAATVQAQATATAFNEASTATTETWSTAIIVAKATSVAELARTVTIQAEATSIASKQVAATATALNVAATFRARFTATAKAQTATVISRQTTATAQVQATATAQAHKTALAQAWSTTVVVAKVTSVAEVKATVTTAIQATTIAEAKATATARSQVGMLLILELQEVTVVKDQSDGLDEQMEFFMKLRVSDNRHSTSLSYPAEGGAIPIAAAQSIPLNQHVIAIDERNIVGDEITIDIIAVDVDDQSIDEELLNTLVDQLIDLTLYGRIKNFNGLTKFLPALGPLIKEIEELLESYFDLIGKGRIILRRSEQWGAGPLLIHWKGEGLNVKYRVYLTDKAPVPPTEWPR